MSERPRFENREYEEPENISVDQDESWKITKAPNTIETTELGPCVGVIVYDTESKQAMVGHFIDPRENDLRGMLDDAVKLFPDISKLKIFVGGQEPNPDDAPDFTRDKAVRAFVQKEIEDHGFQESQVKIQWQDSEQSTVLRIDPATGEVEYDQSDDWEDEDD